MKSLFAELRRDVGFRAADETMLLRLGPLVEPEIGNIVDHFYEVIGANDTMRAVFQDDAQVRRQKTHLAAWLRRTFAGDYDSEYVEGRSRVGKVHVEVGLEQRFMFVMMNVLRTDLVELARDRGTEAGWSEAERHAACVAINRVLDLDLAIMLEAYRDSYIQKIKINERLATLGQMAVTIGEEDRSESSAQTARAEALAAIGTLTAGLAHEIRNPLNAAKLQLEVLARRARKLDPEAAESILGRVRIVHTEIDRLNSMLNDFLGLARPEEVASEAVRVRDIFDEILQLQEPLCVQSNVQLSVGCESGIAVTGDRHRLKQVFENLVNNARQALEEQGAGRIWLECEEQGEWVRLRVRDDGPGFGTDAYHLAQPFVTTKPAGTGLGLPIVTKIVELHGGRLELANLPSGGACADVLLPKRR